MKRSESWTARHPEGPRTYRISAGVTLLWGHGQQSPRTGPKLILSVALLLREISTFEPKYGRHAGRECGEAAKLRSAVGMPRAAGASIRYAGADDKAFHV